ncbi:MAG: hypothetical protein EOP11_01520 [Proteobacteria bacterium]|nr:MAG: hypothetical protein EOP11_01520 [Pseudomonadota bacterium]
MRLRRAILNFCLIGLGALTASPALAASFPITPTELAEFAAATGAKVPEIRQARRLSENKFAMLATYGSTSRELLLFVRKKAEALGSRDGYRLWLADQDSVPLLSFHRLGTPLNFVLLSRAKNASAARLAELKGLANTIAAEAPATIFAAKPITKLSTELDPELSRAHYEPLEHILLSEKGLEKIPALTLTANGQEVNLSEWGVRILSAETLVFLKNAGPGLPPKPNAEADLTQVLRWIGAQSDYPFLAVPESSKTQLRELLMRTRLLPGVKKLLSAVNGKAATTLAALQARSPDPARTRGLLDEYGITSLAREAGMEKKLLREALPFSLSESDASEDGEPLGENLTVYRRVALPEAQNLSEGALHRESLNGGPPGFYLSANADALGSNDIYLQFTISAAAKAGVDFVRFEDYFVLKHRGALAKNKDGSPKISAIDHDFLVRQQAERLKQLKSSAAAPSQIAEVLAALGSMLDPLRNPGDARSFREVWLANGSDRIANLPLLDALLARPEILREAFRTSDPFWRSLLSRLRMEAKGETLAAAEVKAYSVKELPAVIKLLPLGARARAALLAYPETLSLVRETQGAFWGNFLDGLLEDKTYRASLLSPDVSHPADLAFLRRLASHPTLFKGLPAPVLNAAQAGILENYDAPLLKHLVEASLRAEVPLPRALNPRRPSDLALLKDLAGNAPDRWSPVDWLGRETLDRESIAALKKLQPELWAKILSDSLLGGYPAPFEPHAYAFDDSAADQAAIRHFLARSAAEFGAEPTLEKAFFNRQLVAQKNFRAVLLAEFPALSANVPVHRMKAYAEQLLGDEPGLDLVFALMRKKAKNTADLMAILDPNLSGASFPSELIKETYVRRLLDVAAAEQKRFDQLARSKFQRDAWRTLVREVRGGETAVPSEGRRMPASILSH